MPNDLVSQSTGMEPMEPEGGSIPIVRLGDASPVLQGEQHPGPDIPIIKLPQGGPVRLSNMLVESAVPGEKASAKTARPRYEPETPEIPLAKGGPSGRGKEDQADGGGKGAAPAAGPARGGLEPEAGGGAGDAGLRQAQAEAHAAAAGETPLEGLPSKPIELPGGHHVPGPSAVARKAARDYMAEAGLPYNPPTSYKKVVPEHAARIGKAYDEMLHAPEHPSVAASYNAMISETLKQWDAIKKTGLQVEFNPPGADPYHSNPRLAMQDIRKNNHLFVFPTEEGFGTGRALDVSKNPMLRPTDQVIGGKVATANDIFRIVHDYFGHYKEGVGFRADGEENAWRSHVAMYSPLARPAMTSETRGQNSWLNYGPHGDKNRTAKTEDTIFADQKTGLLPEWAHFSGSHGAVHPAGTVASELRGPAAPSAPELPNPVAHPNWIPQRLVTSKRAGPADPAEPPRLVDMETMRATPKSANSPMPIWDKAALIIKHYPETPERMKGWSSDDVNRWFHDHAVENILHMHDIYPWKDRAGRWYEGMNKVGKDWGKEHDLPDYGVIGGIAGMSPQKDWFQNANLEKRVLNIYRGDPALLQHPLDDDMRKVFLGNKELSGPAKVANREIFRQIDGKSLTEIDRLRVPDDAKGILKAMWIRLHDEAEAARNPDHAYYPIITPEGNFGPLSLTSKGVPERMAWGSLVQIAKAVRSIDAGIARNPAGISELMGEQHKVRDFYNNGIDPHSPHGDLTADTHAVGVAHWRPMSSDSMEVNHNFGSMPDLDKSVLPWEREVGWNQPFRPSVGGSAITGIQGTYPIYADAYRTAARERGILPRRMQSITWEAIRGMMSDRFKKNPENVTRVKDIWRQFSRGNLTANQARGLIYEITGGIREPDWLHTK